MSFLSKAYGKVREKAPSGLVRFHENPYKRAIGGTVASIYGSPFTGLAIGMIHRQEDRAIREAEEQERQGNIPNLPIGPGSPGNYDELLASLMGGGGSRPQQTGLYGMGQPQGNYLGGYGLI